MAAELNAIQHNAALPRPNQRALDAVSTTRRPNARRSLDRKGSWGARRESKQPNDPSGQAGGIHENGS